MATTVRSTLGYVTLNSPAGRLLVPFGLPTVTWLGDERVFADALTRAWSERWLASGQYLGVARALAAGADPAAPETVELTLDLAADKNRRYPPHRRHFIMLARPLADDLWLGLVPALGLEIAAVDRERLSAAMTANLRLELVRKGRLGDVKKLVAAGWFGPPVFRQTPLTLSFYTPAELAQQHRPHDEPLLPQVAEPLSPAPFDPVGLDQELRQLDEALAGASVLLIGAPGSGKTALLNGYLRRRRRRPTLWETSAAALIQGLTDTGEHGWQKNLALLCRELADGGHVLYVNHLYQLFEVGQYEGNAVSLGEALREPLQRGELTLIGEASEEELAQLELRAPGFAALFTALRLRPQDDAALAAVIRAATGALARRHKVDIDAAAVDQIIRLHRRYFPYSGLPGKTIRFLESLILRCAADTAPGPLGVTQVIRAFCLESAMPAALIDPAVTFDRDAARAFFRQRIFGQDHAVDAAVDLLTAVKTGLLRAGKPIANLLFVGPTGVGKTELARTLAEFVFTDPDRLLRFDMSEYADPQAVLRLTGDFAAGGGSLVERVRQQPFAVLLFDELEKAHPNFFDLLLQILGEGRLSDGRGRLANFCSTLVVMTSNVGTASVGFGAGMGFHRPGAEDRAAARHFQQAVQDYFRPELFNRLDQIIPFDPLGPDQQPQVIARQLTLLRRRPGLRDRAVSLDLSRKAVERLGYLGYQPRYGARQMQRTLHRQLVVPAARRLNTRPWTQPLALRVDHADDEDDLQLALDELSGRTAAGQAQVADLNTAAERGAGLRRELQQVLEGPPAIGLLSERDRLTAAKDKLGNDFWQDAERSRRWRDLNRAGRQSKELLARLVDLEGQLLLALTDTAAETDPDALGLDDIDRQLLKLQQRLLLLARPELAYCTLGLYGPDACRDRLLKFYQTLATGRGFSVATVVVRLEDDDYRRDAYPLHPAQAAKNLPVVGYELTLRGDGCPLLWLDGEIGVQRWRAGEQRCDYYIAVAAAQPNAFISPAGVHRRAFFAEKSPRRTVKGRQLSDNAYRVEAELPAADALIAHLERRFRDRLRAELTGQPA